MGKSTQTTRREFLKHFTAMAGCFAATAGVPFAVTEAAAYPVKADRFPQGLASGDPQSDAVLLWTRAVPDGEQGGLATVCQVSKTEDFAELVAEKLVIATQESDYTIRLFVQGLEPDTRYFYRFIANGEVGAQVGRTRTAPAPDAEREVNFAFASCQNFEVGYYGAWARMIADDKAKPESEQIDFVLFLGDFIYEVIGDVPEGIDASRKIPALPDGSEPWVPDGTKPWWTAGAQWAISVEDYRHLYKSYLSDPDLQAARARFPFVSTWDDHEFTNNAWQAHDTYFDDGQPAQERKLAANQAWFEFIPAVLTQSKPIGDVTSRARDFAPATVSNAEYDGFDDNLFATNEASRAAIGSMTIYRSLNWGRMLDLVITDTRSYRSPPVATKEVEALWEGGRIAPVRVIKELDAGRTAYGSNPSAMIQNQGKEIPNPRRDAPVGTVLGAEQKAWFKETLTASDTNWRVWGNSIPALSLRFNLSKMPSVDLEDAYLGTDAWQGFPAELNELMSFMKGEGIANTISCSGDHHLHAAGRLAVDPDADSLEFASVDFSVTSISSGNTFNGAERTISDDNPFRPFIAFEQDGVLVENFNNTILNGVLSGLIASYTGSAWAGNLAASDTASPGLQYLDTNTHGYALARVTQDAFTVDHINVGAVSERHGPDGTEIVRRARLRVPAWRAGDEPQLEGPDFEGQPSFPFG